MIVFNTTYTVPNGDARNFVIWVHQSYLLKAQESGILSAGRMLRVLNHKDQESESFCIQFEVEDNGKLHQWYLNQGTLLEKEMKTLFEGRVLSFSTILESIEVG
ncbi:MAG: DUF4286 family protein [Bacteroidaceae bacterium]|nr:DUF4286 family protein [Prevotellaceae bacterium]MDY5631861.1 DUF4286 family protein [Bacteroidaceae bacterium]